MPKEKVEGFFGQNAAVTVISSTTETSLLSAGGGQKTIPAGSLNPGSSIRIRAWGFLTSAAAPATIALRAKLGSTVIAQLAATAPTVSLTNAKWTIDVILQVRSIAASIAMRGQGFFHLQSGADFAALVAAGLSDTANVLDLTAQQAVDLTVQYGAVSAADSIVCHAATVEILP